MLRRTWMVGSTFQNNLTSLTNQLNRNENLIKWGGGGGNGKSGTNNLSTDSISGSSLIHSIGDMNTKGLNHVSNADINHNNNMNRKMGISRLARDAMRPIKVIHETPYLYVASRNFCNGFECNQYLLVSKQTRQAVFIDASDDWPDDWASFVTAAKIHPTHVFLTHCHIDNIINLSALLYIIEQHAKIQMGLMWCNAEVDWVNAFPRACRRYGRNEEASVKLPMEELCWYHQSYNEKFRERSRWQQNFLTDRTRNNRRTKKYSDEDDDDSNSSYYHEEEEEEEEENQSHSSTKENMSSSNTNREIRNNDILLSCATNRSTSFFELGDHSLMYYIHTPGHSQGHMMLSLPRERLLFTGDVLSYNQIGRVDLPWGSGERLAQSLLALEDFPDNTVLLPGHGRLTTLGRERRENRALRALYERISIGKQEISVGFNAGYL